MIASNIVSNGKLEFINIKSISKINLGFRICLAFLSAFVYYIIFKDTTIITSLTISVVIVSIIIYNQSNGFNRIDLSEDSISFINTIYRKEKTFSYHEITEFKSIVNTQQGLSYNTVELVFGTKFSTTLFKNEFENFDELKLFIHSKINQ